MKDKIIFIFAAIIVFATGIAHANEIEDRFENIIFEEIGREQGLENLSISSVVQDNDGFIWFGTQGGLFKYNGRDTSVYRNDPFDTEGLIHNLIQTIYYDSREHQLWLGTYQGISSLDIGKNDFKNFSVEDHGLSNNVVVAIAKDAQDRMWFGTLDGLNLLDQDNNSFITYEIEGDVVRSLLLDSNGRLLVGTYEGLYQLDEETDTLVHVDMDYPSQAVMTVKEFEKGILTLGLWDGGVMELDMSFNVINHYTYTDNRVYAIEKTKDGILWVGTWGGGLYAQSNDDIHAFNLTKRSGGINHPIIYSLLEDSTGLLWIGTNGGGAFKTNPTKKNYLVYAHDPNDPESLDEGKINTIYRDAKGSLWIAIYNKGLNRVTSEFSKVVKYNEENAQSHKLVNNQIMDLIDYEGQLLFASGSGVDLYDPETDQIVDTHILPEDTITYALEIDSNNHLWVGTYLDGVYMFDRHLNLVKNISTRTDSYTLSDNLVYDLLCDQRGRVWIATNNGLNLYDPLKETIHKYFKEDGKQNQLATNTVKTILEAEDGTIWIGMVGGGIARYLEDSDDFKSYTEVDGLVDNTVISMEESDDGKIWIATHNGISVLDPQTDHILNLSTADGIGGYTFSGDGFKDSDGSLYFVGTHGVTRFPSQTELVGSAVPPIYITDFKNMQVTVEEMDTIYNNRQYHFDSNENYVSFEFNAIDYEYLSHIQYSHRLLGIDENWVESGNRNYVSYSNLPAGDYLFEVRAKTIQGIYTEPVHLVFSIKKAWYNTIWAYAIYALIGLFVVYSLIKIRENLVTARKNSELNSLNIQLEAAVKELEEVSTIDGLTGIYNRRYFNTVLEEQFQLAKRSNLPISILMIDVDDFKDINDLYGHMFGDKYLIEFSRAISESLMRSTDFCARFGGDEFAVVLYDTDLSGAEAVAASIRERIAVLTIGLQEKSVKIASKVCIGGYSVIPGHQMDLEGFITAADDALYEAKRNGKDKTIIKS